MKKIALTLLLLIGCLFAQAQEVKMDQSDLYIDGERVGYLHRATRIINKEEPQASHFHYVFVLEKEISREAKRAILQKTRRKGVATKVEYVELYRSNKVRTTIAYANAYE